MPWLRGLTASVQLLRDEADRPAAWRLGVTVLLVASGGLLAALAPLALKGMVDEASRLQGLADRASSERALMFGLVYLAALCVCRLLGELRPSLSGAAEQRLYARLRRRYFSHLLSLPLAFHLERQAGALGQALQQAISGYQILIHSLVNSVIPVLVELLTVTFVLASLSQPALTAAFAVTALAYIAIARFRLTEIGSSARQISEAGMEAHAMLTDALVNVETLKCFNAQAPACLLFERAASMLEDRWTTYQRARLRAGLNVTATFALAIAAVLAIALHGVLHGTLSIGGFVLANAYLFQLVRPLEMLGNAARDISQAVEFIRPMREVLTEPSEERRNCGAAPQPRTDDASDRVVNQTQRHPTTKAGSAEALICFRDVHFGHGDGATVLRGINLDIAEGSTVAIVGASGSGKSSLIRLLLRLHEPRAGTILLDGVDIGALSLRELRSLIAVVPQDTVLFNAPIAFNIGIAKAGATPHEVERAARVAELHDFVVSLPAGYETMVGERGMKVSGGQRQRIAIARAVLKGPLIYLFDEATSMLDSATERDVLHNLRKVSALATTVIVAHRLSTIQDADEIVVLDGGRFVERGDHAALMSMNGTYAAMWRAQQGTAPV
jgi:ATP-binding cassette subfamily B protein